MILTRDFILVAVAVSFLIVGIFATWLRNDSSQAIDFSEGNSDVEAVVQQDNYNTTERLAVLQEKVSRGEGLLESAPANFRSIDQLRAEEAAEAARLAVEEEEKRVASTAPQYCTTMQNGPLWGGIDTAQMSDGRINFISLRTNGTTTESFIAFSLPVRAVRSSFDSCLDNSIIGATSAGWPLQNTDVAQYQNTYQGTLIGYSRDGFGIYGPVADPETLDACGGRYEGDSYRYHVRAGAPTLISCFAGVPEQITINQ